MLGDHYTDDDKALVERLRPFLEASLRGIGDGSGESLKTRAARMGRVRMSPAIVPLIPGPDKALVVMVTGIDGLNRPTVFMPAELLGDEVEVQALVNARIDELVDDFEAIREWSRKRELAKALVMPASVMPTHLTMRQ